MIETHPPLVYVGLVTRVLAFSVDAAIINAVALGCTAAASLALSVINLPDSAAVLTVVTGGTLYLLWTVGYFATFWTTTGQTPGNRLLRIRVLARDGEPLLPRRAILRFFALTLAVLPLCAGLLMILVDDRRRGLHDWLARSVVIEAPRERP